MARRDVSPLFFHQSIVPRRFRGVSGAFAPVVCEACVASVLQARCVFSSPEGVGTGRRVVLAACVPYAGWQAVLPAIGSIKSRSAMRNTKFP